MIIGNKNFVLKQSYAMPAGDNLHDNNKRNTQSCLWQGMGIFICKVYIH